MKVFGIAGHSGMGKTTLLERLVPELSARGLVVSLIKHSHKNIDIDRPGKDSYRLRESGCNEVLLLGNDRWALMHELRGADEPPLDYLLSRLQHCDLVLIEGFKNGDFPKLEVWRADGRQGHVVAGLAGHPGDCQRRSAARPRGHPARTVGHGSDRGVRGVKRRGALMDRSSRRSDRSIHSSHGRGSHFWCRLLALQGPAGGTRYIVANRALASCRCRSLSADVGRRKASRSALCSFPEAVTAGTFRSS